MQPALRNLLLSPPAWVLAGASVDLDFLNSRYYQVGSGGGPANLITCSRASTAYSDDQAGNWNSFASNLPRLTDKGLLVEESRTNSIRNNSGQGAVVNTSYPTNWTNVFTINLSFTLVGIGTENGIDYVDIRVFGTTNGNHGGATSIAFDGNNTLAASNGQTWTTSSFVKLAGGSLSNITGIQQGFFDYTSGAAFIGQYSGSNIIPTTASLGSQRNSYTATIVDATAAFIQPMIVVQLSAGTPTIDVTLRIGWPQLELGASVTSPIRTTSAAATRAADAVSLTKVPAFGSGQSLFFKGNPSTPTGYGVFQGGIIAHDGGNSNRIQIIRVNTTGKDSFLFSGSGVIGLSIDGSVTAQNTSFRAALASTSGSIAYADGGGSSGTSSSTDVPAGSSLTAVRIGDQSSSRQFDGYVERIAIWASTRLSDADLKRIVQ